jgi:hypothetical protein
MDILQKLMTPDEKANAIVNLYNQPNPPVENHSLI